MKRPIGFLPEAEDEVAAAVGWYHERRPGLGIDFLTDIEIASAPAAEQPEAFPIWHRGLPYRKLTMTRFPFLLIYRVTVDQVRVVAVAHAKRRPGYWLRRR